jgi:hypothetical protein
MTSEQTWKDLFAKWPAGIPRRGTLVTTINETVPFKGFMVNDDVLLLERTNPDPLGVRYILLSYDVINSVRFIDPLQESIFTKVGFVGSFSKN